MDDARDGSTKTVADGAGSDTVEKGEEAAQKDGR